MSKFLIATLPFTGHVTPGLPIARALVERGHEVRWYTGSKYRAKVEATGARYVAMRQGHDFDDAEVDRAFPGRADHKGVGQLKFDLKHLFIDAAHGFSADLAATLQEFPADVMINDTACLGVPLLSERIGVPYATFGISVLTTPSRDAAPFGLALKPSATALGRMRNRTLNWAVDNVLFRDVVAHYRAARMMLGLPAIGKQGFFQGSCGPYLYLQATVPSFEYPRSDLPPQVHFVGPYLPAQSAEFVPPAWWSDLDSGRPVVHVTQGTSSTDPRDLILPTLHGLAKEDVLVVATTGGKPLTSVELDPLPDNARLESFLPHAHLLPRVSIMITNAGYGGVQVALAHGIPLIAAGASEEKPEIAARIAWSGVGLDLRTKTPNAEQVRRAVRSLLRDPGYRARARKLRAEIALYDAATRSAQLLEQLARTRQPVVGAALHSVAKRGNKAAAEHAH